jgi:putative lipoic acid-binding regulatory protein
MSANTFEKLREQLELQEWPNVYFFKFIIRNDPKSIASTSDLFDETADLNFHTSSGGKFTSVSAKVLMLNVDSIIELYEKAQKIPGIISL